MIRLTCVQYALIHRHVGILSLLAQYGATSIGDHNAVSLELSL